MPNYHGMYSLLWSSLIPLILFLLFIIIDTSIKERLILSYLPEAVIQIGQDEINYSVNVLKNNIRNLDSIIASNILPLDSANTLYDAYSLSLIHI